MITIPDTTMTAVVSLPPQLLPPSTEPPPTAFPAPGRPRSDSCECARNRLELRDTACSLHCERTVGPNAKPYVNLRTLFDSRGRLCWYPVTNMRREENPPLLNTNPTTSYHCQQSCPEQPATTHSRSPAHHESSLHIQVFSK